jgi:hypothetical protein
MYGPLFYGPYRYKLLDRNTYPIPVQLILVSTRYSFDRSALQAFERKYKLGINLSHDQEDNLGKTGKTQLTIPQLSQILDDLYPSKDLVAGFIEEASEDLAPIAVTLFVLNDATWKLMKHKPIFPEKMLPMSTIPWFYCTEMALSPENPRGIQRNETGTCRFIIDPKSQELIINGEGGDYSGIVEDRVAQLKIGARPLFVPGWFGSNTRVIWYEFQHLEVRISLRDFSTELYPPPDSRLDYGFSESPKVFYMHGIKLFSDGANVKLKVGNRSRSKLAGEVIIYIGKSLKSIKQSYETLLFHLWLNTLREISMAF